MIEHCISAFLEEQKQECYKLYVAEALQIISKNSALLARSEDAVYLKNSLRELWYPENKKKEEKPKTGEELVDDFFSALGI